MKWTLREYNNIFCNDRFTNETALIKRFFDITIPKSRRAPPAVEVAALAPARSLSAAVPSLSDCFFFSLLSVLPNVL